MNQNISCQLSKKVTLRQVQPIFKTFKRKLKRFPKVKKVKLWKGIVERGFSTHDIDVAILLKSSISEKAFEKVTLEIFNAYKLFPLPLEAWIERGSLIYIQRNNFLVGFKKEPPHTLTVCRYVDNPESQLLASEIEYLRNLS